MLRFGFMTCIVIGLVVIVILCLNIDSTDSTDLGKSVRERRSFQLGRIPVQVVYINLERHVDRRQHIEKELRLFYPVRFGAVERKNGAVGCLLSHIEVLKRVEPGHHVMIFEDDFEWSVSEGEACERMKEVDEKLPWDVIVLSQYVWSWSHVSFPGQSCKTSDIRRLWRSTSTAGYLVHARYIPKLLSFWMDHAARVQHKDRFEEQDHLDQVQRILQEQDWWIGFHESLGHQRGDISSVGEGWAHHTWKIHASELKWLDSKGISHPFDKRPTIQME